MTRRSIVGLAFVFSVAAILLLTVGTGAASASVPTHLRLPEIRVNPATLPTINYYSIHAFANATSTIHVANVATNAGDSIVVFVAYEDPGGTGNQLNVSVSDNRSDLYERNLYHSDGNPETYGLGLWTLPHVPFGNSYRLLTLGINPVSMPPLTVNMTVQVIDFTHVNGGYPFDYISNFSVGLGTAVKSANTTTHQFEDIAIMAVSAYADPTTTATGGDAKLNGSTAGHQVTGGTFYEIVDAPNTVVMNATLSKSEHWRAATIAVMGPTPPNPPTNVSVIAANATNLTVSWTLPMGPVLNITLAYCYGSNCSMGIDRYISVGNVTRYVISPLLTGVTYTFHCTAWNSTGESVNSSTASGRTVAPVVPFSSSAIAGLVVIGAVGASLLFMLTRRRREK